MHQNRVQRRSNIHYIHNRKDKLRCAECNSRYVIRSGYIYHDIKCVPVGHSVTILRMKVQRLECKECGCVRQEKFNFVKGKRCYTNKYSRYVVELFRIYVFVKSLNKSPTKISRYLFLLKNIFTFAVTEASPMGWAGQNIDGMKHCYGACFKKRRFRTLQSVQSNFATLNPGTGVMQRGVCVVYFICQLEQCYQSFLERLVVLHRLL